MPRALTIEEFARDILNVALDAWQVQFIKDLFANRLDNQGWPTRDSAAPQEDC